MSKRLCGAIAAVLLLPMRAEAAAILSIGSATANVGDTFSIDVAASGLQGLTAFQFDLAFNPAVLQVLSFSDVGSNFDATASAGGAFLTGITGFVDNGGGSLSGVADSISGLLSGNGLAPSGVLVEIDFQAIAPGVSPLDLSNALFIDDNVLLSPTVANGSVTVDGVMAVPEPGPLTVFAAALTLLSAAIGFRPRRHAPKQRDANLPFA